jgi:uncharacterized tellurite resistance protein B-like protein
MRPYPRNSPQAAARIVSLALLADGHLSQAEIDTLDLLDLRARLGLDRPALMTVVHELCEDLLHSVQLSWSDACRIDPRALAQLLAEIDDPALRRTVLDMCLAVAEADGDVSEGESIVLVSAIDQWGLQHSLLA